MCSRKRTCRRGGTFSCARRKAAPGPSDATAALWKAGRLADLVALDAGHLSLCGLRDDQVIDGWIFAADDRVVSDVWSAGRHCVINGRHVRRDAVERRYRSAMAELLGLL